MEPLSPRILIFDQNFRLQYQYTHPSLVDSPQQDFVLTSWQIQLGVNSNAGSCNITIEDHDHTLTDDEGNLLIETGYIIQILLGKRGGTSDNYFTGIVNQPAVNRPGYNQQHITISAFGYSNTLATRYINLTHEQRRNSDDTFDDTDETAKVSEIVKRVFDDSNLLLPPTDPNISLDGIQDIDLKIASVQKNAQSQGIVISELANIADAVYGITPDLTFYFRGTGQHGGFIISNAQDLSEHDADTLMLIRDAPYQTQDSNIRKAFTALIGLDLTIQNVKGGFIQGFDTWRVQEVTGFRLRRKDDAFNSYQGSIPKDSLQIMMRRTQEVSTGIAWRIFESTGNSNIRWTVSTSSAQTRASGVISEGTLNSLALNQNVWVDIFAELPATSDAERWLLLRPESNSPGTYDGIYLVGLEGQVGDGSTRNRGDTQFMNAGATDSSIMPRYRIAEEVQSIVTAQNLQQIASGQVTKENMQYVPNTLSVDAATAIFEGLLQQSGQRRRTYNMTVSAPSTRPEMGKRVSIVDTFNGVNTDALLIGLDVGADMNNQLMATDINIELERFI